MSPMVYQRHVMNQALFTMTLIFIYVLEVKTTVSITPEGKFVLSLKAAVDHSSESSAFSGWNENDTTPCKWEGVTCMDITGSSDPRVVSITVVGKNLRGKIPPELGNLAYLRRLNLHDNGFAGSIPTRLFDAGSLHSVLLHGNNLSGDLPPSICTLPRLQNLDLSKNSFSGSLPETLSDCKQLQRLILARNKFSGEIPAKIWSEMDNMVQLDLSSNNFHGKIPDEIGELKSLSSTLNLSFNNLSGRIPRSLGNLSVTVSLDLRNNNLSGEIPQTGSLANQGPTAFLDNPFLCGFPLRKPCDDATASSSENPTSLLDFDDGHPKRLSTGMIVSISAADAAGVAFLGLIIVYIYWKTKEDRSKCSCNMKIKLSNEKSRICLACSCINKNGNNDSEMEEPERMQKDRNGELVAMDRDFKLELDDLLRASAHVLGKSELGILYKVVIGNGFTVAVRRLGDGGEQKYKEFVAEVQAIGRIKHPNIVRLKAYYWAADEKLLVSEFISNGSLASALKGRSGHSPATISWGIRLRIAKGTAKAIAHLHECSSRKFIHGDIKPSNVLLDDDFHPHISNFGLNRLINLTGNNPASMPSSPLSSYFNLLHPERSQSRTYCAPEAGNSGNRPTQKWDVYSFGVILLELLAGQSLAVLSAPASSDEASALVRRMRKGFEEKPLSENVDLTLLQEFHARKEVRAVLEIALACTEDDPDARPKMRGVSENLDKI